MVDIKMRVIVIGMGVQGYKRKKFAGKDYVASIDPVNKEADFRDITEVDVDTYDAAMLCIPDEPKIEILTYLARHGKHALVEKPLFAKEEAEISSLEALARKNRVFFYTAYNHRFEPHYIRMRNLIISGELGRIYSCRMFYGNGTARLVRDSAWRDQGAGVLPDLGSHMLDTAKFWFPEISDDFIIASSHCHENRAPDQVIIHNEKSSPRMEIEMILLSWRNHFTCDVFAEKGSAHIRSLCKWGPSTFTVRRRILPSGRPPEESITLVQDDPTWELEYAFFKSQCKKSMPTDFSNDVRLNKLLGKLSKEALETNNA
jgi:scyllo-inositol 2-dehydrogenase (NADP+)